MDLLVTLALAGIITGAIKLIFGMGVIVGVIIVVAIVMLVRRV